MANTIQIKRRTDATNTNELGTLSVGELGVDLTDSNKLYVGTSSGNALTGLPTAGGTLTGNLNANGLVSGVWSGNGTFRGIFHSAQTGSEYCLISNDTNTILSASTGYGVFIRGGNNVSTYQIGVYHNQLPTAGGNTILTTASGLELSGGTLTGSLEIENGIKLSRTSQYENLISCEDSGGNQTLKILGNRAASNASTGTDVRIGGEQNRTTGNAFEVVQGSSTYFQIASSGAATFFGNSITAGGGTLNGGLTLQESDGRSTLTLVGAKTSDGNYGDILGSNNSGAGRAQISFRRISNDDATGIVFYTEATGGSMGERMRVDNDGALLINTASKGTNSGKFFIGSPLTTDSGAIAQMNGFLRASYIITHSAGTGASNHSGLQPHTNNTGNVGNTSARYYGAYFNVGDFSGNLTVGGEATFADQDTRWTYSGNKYLRSDQAFYFLANSSGSAQRASFSSIQVSDSYSGTPPTNGILFGTDTQLYRSAANTLSLGSDDSLKLGDSSKIKLGDSNDLEIYHDGFNSYIKDAGTGSLLIEVAGTGDSGFYKVGGEKLATFEPDGPVSLYHNNSKKLETTSTGVSVTGSLNVSGISDLSTDTTSWVRIGGRNAFRRSNNFLYLGNDNWSSGLYTTINVRMADGYNISPYSPTPSASTTLGTSSYRWPTIYGAAGDFSGNLTVGGTIAINTTSPYAYDTTATQFEVSAGTTTVGEVEVARFRGGDDADTGAAIVRITNDNDRGLVLKGGRTGTAAFADIGVSNYDGSFTRGIRIDGAGRCGIGIAAPYAPLQVHNSADQAVVLSGATNPFIRWQSGSSNKAYVKWENSTSTFIIRNEAASQELRYNSTGLGVGVVPSAKLQVLVASSDGSASAHGVHFGTATNGLNIGANDSGNYAWLQTKNNNDLVISPYGAKVGIGTVSPSYNLSVEGANSQIIEVKSTSTHASVIADRFNTSADANFILATNGTNKWRLAMMDGDDYLQIYDDINDQVHTVFKSDGSVGIGTVSPVSWANLHVAGAIHATNIINTDDYFRVRSGGVTKVIIDGNGDSYFNGGNVGIGVTPAATLHVQASSPEFRLATASSAVVRLRTSGDNYINTGQNLGIGTVSPSAKLHIKDANPVIKLEDSDPDGVYGQIDAAGGDFIIAADGGAGSANSFISFRLDGTAASAEKVRITSTGVGIGTTSPSQKLHVSGNVRATEFLTSTGNNRTKIKLWDTSTNYGIGMYSYMTYGGLNDYAMTFQFNDESDRGFWWGDSTHTNAQGAMALTTNGKLTVAHSIRLGFGESDTTTPGSAARLEVNGNVSGTRFLSGGTITNGIYAYETYGSSFESSSVRLKEQGSGENEDPGILFQKGNAASTGDHCGGIYFQGTSDLNYAIIRGTCAGSSKGQLNIHIAGQQNTITRTSNDTPVFQLGEGGLALGATPNDVYKLYVNGTSYFSQRILVDDDIDFQSRGDYITFYGDSSRNHAITSRDNDGNAADDLRINSYGALYVNLDSNNNNSSGANFEIGRHGSTGSITDWLFTVFGETGRLKLHTYGSGNNTGTVEKYLAVTSAGVVIETDGTSSGSGTVNETHAAGTEHQVAVHLGSSTVGEGHKLIYNSSSGLTVNSTSSETDSTYALYVSGGIKNSTGGLYVTGDGYISSRLGVATSVDTSYGIKVAGYIASYGHTTWSDYRLKENATLWNTSEAATLVKDVPVYSYRWNDNCEAKSVQDQDRIGFLAHEVSEKINKNNLVINEKDGEKYQSVNQTDMIPILWAALQDALKRIEELEAK